MSSFLRRMMMAAAMNKGVPTTYLTDDVKAYATSFGVLDGLNEYIGEHPKMIKYINEWKYIIHSLGLGTGYTSWLKGDGSAYIDSGVILNKDSKSECKYIYTAQDQCPFGSRKAALDTGFMVFQGSAGEQFFAYGSKNYVTEKSTYFTNEEILVTISNGSCIFKRLSDEKTLEITYDVNSFKTENDISAYIMGANQNGSLNRVLKGKISYCILDEHSFLPYYDSKSKKFGMLDVSADTPKFYGAEPNTGEFTWSLTDADGNEVLSFKETDLPKCLVDACFSYGISTANMESAYDIDNDIVKSFNGVGRGITSQALSWIDTEYVAQKSSEFVLDCIFLTKDTLGWCSLFGAETTEGGTDSFLIRRKASQDALLGAFGKYDSSYGEFGNFKVENVFDNRHIITFNKNGISVDGGICDIITPFNEDTYSPSNLTIYLFALNNNGNISRKGNTTLYSLVINEDGKKKGYFIPIISNGEKCLYDLIEGKVHHDKHTSNEFIIQ